jgi:hypothetical protein
MLGHGPLHFVQGDTGAHLALRSDPEAALRVQAEQVRDELVKLEADW